MRIRSVLQGLAALVVLVLIGMMSAQVTLAFMPQSGSEFRVSGIPAGDPLPPLDPRRPYQIGVANRYLKPRTDPTGEIIRDQDGNPRTNVLLPSNDQFFQVDVRYRVDTTIEGFSPDTPVRCYARVQTTGSNCCPGGEKQIILGEVRSHVGTLGTGVVEGTVPLILPKPPQPGYYYVTYAVELFPDPFPSPNRPDPETPQWGVLRSSTDLVLFEP